MPNHLELAELSKQVYFKNGGFKLNWHCLDYYSDETGLAVGVYQNDQNEMVIAFRGTDTGNISNFLKNTFTNLQIIFSTVPSTVSKACDVVTNTRASRGGFQRIFDFIKTKTTNQLYLTGHSLGGMIAQFVGFEMLKKQKNYQVITFENPGIRNFITPALITNYKQQIDTQFLTYLANPNLINTFSPHIGIIKRIPTKCCGNHFFGNGNINIKNITDCIVNDLFRLMLLLLLTHYVFNDDLSAAFILVLMNAGQYLSSYLGKGHHFVETNLEAADKGLFPYLNSLAAFVSYHAISELISKTSRQHMLDNIISYLQTKKGNVSAKEIISWPNKKEYVLSKTMNLLGWFSPFHHKSLLSLTNLDILEEEAIQNMWGYKEK